MEPGIMQQRKGKNPLFIIDIVISLIASAFVIHIFSIGFTSGFVVGPAAESPLSIYLGIYLQLFGLLYVLSFFFSNRSWILHGLMWTCENGRCLHGKYAAFFYAAIAFICGTTTLLIGMDIISNS